ncbi:MAG TPA: site-specific integrase [Saprospiraceae bacterium]|nr:site-specific integrase [Saprospiraceae bacterium]HMU02210.1 site-specific integrase [Saprospiraceae bacterium]
MRKLEYLKISYILRKDRIQNDLAPVYLKLLLEGRKAYVSTGEKVRVSEWDERSGKFLGSTPLINSKNELLDRMRLEVINIYNELKAADKDITVDLLRSRLAVGETDNRKYLLECCQIYNSSFEKLVGIEIGKITFGRYATFAARISEFITKKLKQKDIYLTDIKYSFGIEYEHYLKTELKLHQNTLVKYIQYLNRVLDYCVKYEWLEKNVLFGYKCPVKETKREYLTQDELQRIMDKEIKIERLREVRDIFVFCCHTGYAYKDAAELTPDHIGTGINGRKWIYTSRQKTDNVSNVPLLDQAMEIIEKYKDHPICVSKNRLLPMKSNQKLNSYLKELADICSISKPMTMHIARHTFATTVLLSNGVSMEATSKMLGHSSLKTTQIYGKILETRVGAEMEMLSAKLSKPVDAEIKLKEAK